MVHLGLLLHIILFELFSCAALQSTKNHPAKKDPALTRLLLSQKSTGVDPQEPSTSSLTPCFIGLDVGTQGTKCLAYCPEQGDGGVVVARAAVSYGLNPTTIQGRAEQEPSPWSNACAKSARKSKTNTKLLVLA